ncbi:MAG: hypothetical protein ABSF83_11170 [Nitrososphaerales archaeon]|jgi:hypothetical protein
MTPERPPADLVEGEVLLWKMADVTGLLVRRLVTGYLVTNYRSFVWDAEADSVRVSVPAGGAQVTVEGRRRGKRTMRGGTFIVPKTADYVPPTMGEAVEVGDLFFRVPDGRVAMVFRGVAEPDRVAALLDHLSANARLPDDLGVDSLWMGEAGPDDGRRRR